MRIYEDIKRVGYEECVACRIRTSEGWKTMSKESDLTKIPHKILEEAQKAGLETQEKNRSGTFFHLNQETVAAKVNELYEGKLELMDIKAALKKYSWLEEYMWKLVSKDKDEYTKKVAEDYSGGYFMRILPGAEISFPLQSCLMITQRNLEQRVHNIIIAEENSKAHIITSCLQHSTVPKASHLGISEIYVKKGAMLNFTMIHQWSENTLVRPRSGAKLKTKQHSSQTMFACALSETYKCIL